MKHALLIFLVLCALTLSGSMSTSDKTLMAGAAETVITRVKDRPEVYQDLYARALVLAEGAQRLAVVTLDIGTVNYAVSEQLLKAINAATGIPAENILICPSQTHSAPGVDGRHLSPESREWLAGSLAELVKAAADGLRPATLRVGRAPAQIGYNRRLMKNGRIVMEPNPDGAVVPWVDVLAAYDEEGNRIGVLFSHAAHPVIVHWSSKAIGPDFPGYAVKHLHKLLAAKDQPEGVFMFAQGSCGNINGYPLRGGFAACDAAGLSLAFAVTQALEADQAIAPGPLKSRSLTLSLPHRANQNGERQFLHFPMRAVAIGDDVCILTVTGELFAEYQLWVDEASPFKHTFVFNHVNGLSSYIATKKDYDLGPAGGYEAWDGPTRGGGMPLDPSVEQIVKDGMLKLLNDLKSAGK
ncbi:hypothetical protein LCGC14_0124090 [marine sediment metagenome]|uniref:Neutral/alkaline non-lysosomal ceramidase N-terminal domain-containing protein n=1 Tax=marine sediment metagenome TaxID=412755 RepID=A0A0F9V9F1_9ZZZZ|nr:hypothetical protein [Phycisphaerae bacterium]HDZ42310.1 hypothetical protein [Phycisphaerae bacterium]